MHSLEYQLANLRFLYKSRPVDFNVSALTRVPRANPSGSNQAIDGVIDVAMNTWYLQSSYDTLRFRMTIEDRSLNLSNEDTT